MYTPILSAMMLAGAASAAVIAQRAEPTVWKSPDGGNTQVRFGDGRMYVGGCEPKDILATLYDNCYGEGFCNSKSWSMECLHGDGGTHTVTIEAPEGQYQPWIKNGLVEALQAALAVDGVTTSEPGTAMSGGGCVGCPWTSTKFTMHTMPDTIGISHLNEGNVPDVITLSLSGEKGDGGLCEIMTGIGGAVAGAVNGVAGGIFALSGLACKAI